MQLLSEFPIHNLTPAHQDYPDWPGGERWLQLYQSGASTQVVITKGLSDGESSPFELYLQTDELIAAEQFRTSWQASLVYALGRIIPDVKQLPDWIGKYTYLTVQVQMDKAPKEWSKENKNGNVGVFIGLKNPAVNESFKSFTALNVKLMRPEELAYCIEHANEGRMKMAEWYGAQGKKTISNLQRPGVVGGIK
jgi:hypothetical protein